MNNSRTMRFMNCPSWIIHENNSWTSSCLLPKFMNPGSFAICCSWIIHENSSWTRAWTVHGSFAGCSDCSICIVCSGIYLRICRVITVLIWALIIIFISFAWNSKSDKKVSIAVTSNVRFMSLKLNTEH